MPVIVTGRNLKCRGFKISLEQTKSDFMKLNIPVILTGCYNLKYGGFLISIEQLKSHETDYT